MYSVDALDGRIIMLFATQGRLGVLEASRRLGVARGTVQARLDRLEAAGVVTGWAPAVDPAALGFPVSAFATLEIAQGGAGGSGHDPVASHLRAIPEVLEAHTITGGADMMVRLVARSNADLQRVIDQVVAHSGVSRASTVIVLATEISARVLPLVESATGASGPHDGR
jgi:DNA-binding Lrp family transcriptional regulator